MTKNIVITGASAGIGAAVARKFSKEYEVVLLARRKEKLMALEGELGKNVRTFALDVSSRNDVERVFQEIGSVSILVNNAGMAAGLDPAQKASLDGWEECIDVNIKGLLFCTHAVLPGMCERNQGHIINLGSTAGTYPYPGGNVYCGTKAFVHQFSLCLRSDLLGTNVRVSCIEPGLVGGTDFSVTRFKGDVNRAKKLYEGAHALTPEDIADLIYFTVSMPAYANINSVEIMPVTQAFGSLLVHKQSE